MLGVTPDADVSAVRRAFRTLARQLHPDVCDDPAAARCFILVHSAYRTLTDPASRRAYLAELSQSNRPLAPRRTSVVWDRSARDAVRRLARGNLAVLAVAIGFLLAGAACLSRSLVTPPLAVADRSERATTGGGARNWQPCASDTAPGTPAPALRQGNPAPGAAQPEADPCLEALRSARESLQRAIALSP
ncbi:MAG: J domain-containing protein [Phycisphaerae bacterium]